MTLRNHKNHYNVKFLSGYGLSVSLKDNKILLKNGTYPYSDVPEQEEWFITNFLRENNRLSQLTDVKCMIRICHRDVQ